VLRRVIPREYVNRLWLKVRHAAGRPGKDCPVCRRPMAEVPVPVDRKDVPLDVCASCQFVWFDPHEFERFPVQVPRQAARRPLPQEARERIALARIKQVAQRERGADFGEAAPEEWWQWLPALFGMPVEQEVDPIQCRPWLTWSLGAAMVLTFLLTLGNLPQIAPDFGLVPARALRRGGITLITSFFLHAGWLHLIGNLYFLLIFGDNVEDYLGRTRYWVLVFAAAVSGDLLHIAGDPGSLVPCVGASGGISGVITFYALKFPRARLGFLVRYWFLFRWLHMPAWFALILWFLLQLLLAAQQLAGIGSVSALAHLGGAAAGLGLWLLWWKR